MEDKYLIKILMVDDDELFSLMISEALQLLNNVDFRLLTTAEEFFKALDDQPDVAIIDYNLPDKNGVEILTELKKQNNSIIPIVLSGQEDFKVVVEAYKKGAHRYIMKNENAAIELIQNIRELSKTLAIKKELEALRENVIEQNHSYKNIIGDSDAIKKVFRLMQKVENIDMPVLITGNNGTGKELIAQALHYNSDRKRKPFVAVNVAAIPEDLIETELFGHEKGAFTGANGKRIGKFEEANKGTLFLDEIGEMDINLQTKLLRVLQERKITRLGGNTTIDLTCRVITASNKNLWKEVQAGNFREDLYFRLQGFIINVPSLKERGNDIVILAQHFMKTFCEKQRIEEKRISSGAIQKMMSYSWPGNVRELKSMIERAVLISDEPKILSEDLVFLEQDIL
ncbi:MAG: sigma-54-dependent Fis family transcriptional regulator [Vicingus serpentipes]|nr:sigma-54-dependent Fis family transcriptional regulator [Vicingus serpentipes]